MRFLHNPDGSSGGVSGFEATFTRSELLSCGAECTKVVVALAVPVRACQRHPSVTVFGLCQQSLVEVQFPRSKLVFRTRHVESPDSIRGLVCNAPRFVGRGLESPHPLMQSHGIVLAQAFDVPHLKANYFRSIQTLVERDQFPVREDISVNERWAALSAVRNRTGDSAI